ncbi:MAG TPA: DUF2807 domain-containing protein [Elusimicrobia bacterium]|nr:DUF2807 domain-containing protein [Elusimicrobiota bacterium]
MKMTMRCSVMFSTALCVFAGCAAKLDGIKGSGNVKTESRVVAGFTSVSLGGMGKVILRQTGKESLVVSAEDNLLPLLESSIVDHVLKLNMANNANIHPTKPIEFIVEVVNLEGLIVSGAGNIEAGDIWGKRLSVSLSGVGNVTVSGTADELELKVSGVGGYNGEKFKTRRAVVQSSGVGKAVVNVSEQLDAEVSGVGSVEYIGSPKVRETVSGVGSVKKR